MATAMDGEELDLSGKGFTVVPIAELREALLTGRVTKVYLSQNSLTTLSDEFCSLDQLVVLDLSRNAIKRLPDDFGGLCNLLRLNLKENKLKNLPDSFSQLVKLEWLDLRGNRLEQGLAEVVKQSQTEEECATKVLQYVNGRKSSGNKSAILFSRVWTVATKAVATVTPRSRGGERVEVTEELIRARTRDDLTDLSRLSLTQIPVEIVVLAPRAMKLSLSHNNIRVIPENFVQLRHLTELNLSRNSLTELPDNFGQLSNLQRLDLHGNRLTTLPHAFWQLSKLEWLDLRNNQLEPELKRVADIGRNCTEQKGNECAEKVLQHLRKKAQERERKRHLEMPEPRRARSPPSQLQPTHTDSRMRRWTRPLSCCSCFCLLCPCLYVLLVICKKLPLGASIVVTVLPKIPNAATFLCERFVVIFRIIKNLKASVVQDWLCQKMTQVENPTAL